MHIKEHASCLTKLSCACKNRYRENDLVHQIVSPAVRFIMGLFDQQLLFSVTKPIFCTFIKTCSGEILAKFAEKSILKTPSRSAFECI